VRTILKDVHLGMIGYRKDMVARRWKEEERKKALFLIFGEERRWFSLPTTTISCGPAPSASEKTRTT
jgi:hypothetical protein